MLIFVQHAHLLRFLMMTRLGAHTFDMYMFTAVTSFL